MSRILGGQGGLRDDEDVFRVGVGGDAGVVEA